MFDVLTIGSVTYDNFLLVEAEIVKDKEVPSQKAYFLPLGEKLEVLKMIKTLGGNSSNAAVTFSRHGFKTACMGKIGKDIYGQEILKFLKKEKVNTDLIKLDPKLDTAYSTILLYSGERTILSYHGASHYLNFSDFKFNQMKSRWWYISLPGNSYKVFEKLIELADKNNIAVAFNPSGYHLKKDRAGILKNLSRISVLFLNEEEAAILSNISWKKEEEVFLKLDKLMPKILVITKGRKGAVVSDNKYIYRAGIFKDKKVLDRTGAGDAFGSGFISGFLSLGIDFYNIDKVKPEDILYATRLASANATSVVEKIGATTGILKIKEFKQNKRFNNLKVEVSKI